MDDKIFLISASPVVSNGSFVGVTGVLGSTPVTASRMWAKMRNVAASLGIILGHYLRRLLGHQISENGNYNDTLGIFIKNPICGIKLLAILLGSLAEILSGSLVQI